MRYFIEFSYNGAPYFGFQIQPREVSVQETLEKALSLLLKENIKIVGAGRTDTGVHAKKMYAHFETEQNLPTDLVKRLNSFLPQSVAIRSVFSVPEDLHARFSATYRTYQYIISTSKNPFTEKSAWQFWRKPLDIKAMNEACIYLKKHEDFTSFAKLHTDNKTNICKLQHAEWHRENTELIFTITSDRFLRNMVRSIVGTLVEVGVGKISPESINDIINKKNRNEAGISAPAHGLYLVDVGYSFGKKEILLKE